MKIPVALATLLLAAVTQMGDAQAQEKLRKNETYCLLTSEGGGEGGGGAPLLCRFETLQQCFASKTSNSDTCMLNPAIGYQPARNR
jgi:hypothetical protein